MTTAASMCGLRAAHKARTRLAIEDAAWRLFAERGFDDVTLAEVAGAAGVGLRTVFRYFPTKDRLLDGGHGEILAAAAAALAAVPTDTRLSDVLRGAAEDVVRTYTSDPDRARVRAELARTDAAAAARQLALDADWAALLTAEIARRLPAAANGPGDGDLRAAVLAGAVMGAIRGALSAWLARPGADPVRLVDDALAIVACALDAAPAPRG